MRSTFFPAKPALGFALALFGCGGRDHTDAGPDVSTGDATRRLYASTTDYNSLGQLAAVDLATSTSTDNIAVISADGVLARHGDLLVVMNSAMNEDNVTYFDTREIPPRLVTQIAAHERDAGVANPRGYVAVGPTRGYLALFNRNALAIVDYAAEAVVGSIDLSAFAAGAPRVRPRPIAHVASEVWVALERLPANLMNPTMPGAIARIDPATDTLISTQAIELHHPNPVGRFAVRGANVWIASVGSYEHTDDGAIEHIDANTRAVSDVATEADLNGNVDAVIALDDDRLLARIAGRTMMQDGGIAVDVTRLVEWRISTRIARVWLEVSSYALTEPVLASDGRVYVGDRGDRNPAASRPSAILILDAATGTEIGRVTPAPALPPYDMIE